MSGSSFIFCSTSPSNFFLFLHYTICMRLPSWLTPTRLVLIGIIVLAAALRLWHIGSLPPGLYPDEATNGNDAVAASQGGWDWFYPHNNGREGLFINLQALVLLLVGAHTVWALRIVSALAGTLTVPGIYLLGKALWNRRAGLIAAALLAGSFWHVTFSRIGFRAILAPLVLTWGLGLLILGFKKLRLEKRGSWLVIAGSALAGVGLHTYISFRVAVLAFLVASITALWLSRTDAHAYHRLGRSLTLGAWAFCIAAAPMAYYFYTHPGAFTGRTEQVSVLSDASPIQALVHNTLLTAGMLITRGDMNWRHNFSGQPEIPFIFFVFLIVGTVLAARDLARSGHTKLSAITVLSLVCTGALPAILSNEGLPHALRSILLIVPVMLLTAYGLERTWDRLATKKLPWLGFLIVLLVVEYGFIYTAVRYPLYARQPETVAEFTQSYVELARALQQRVRSVDSYVLVPPGDVRIDGIPVAAQTVMYLTNTATKNDQLRARIYYVTSVDQVPPGSALYVME